MKKIAIISGVLTLMFCVTTVYAQGQLDKSSDEAQSEIMHALSVAAELVDYGQQNNDALSLVSAARILINNPVEEATDEDVTAAEGQTDAPRGAIEDADKESIDLDVTEILAQARSLAQGDDALLEVIAALEDEASNMARGYHYGYVNGSWRIPAYGSREFTWTFTGGEVAEILFDGDNDTDLDFYVYDTNGNLLTSNTDYTDRAYFRWVPSYTKKYIFRVENLGSVYNICRIVSN